MRERISREKKTGASSGKRSSLTRARLSDDQRVEYDAKVGLTKVVSLRLADDDHAAYMAKVKASGMGRSAFFRECVLGNKTQVVARLKPSVDKDRLVYLVKRPVTTSINWRIGQMQTTWPALSRNRPIPASWANFKPSLNS